MIFLSEEEEEEDDDDDDEKKTKKKKRERLDDDDDDETTVDVWVKIALCECERTRCNTYYQNVQKEKRASGGKKTSRTHTHTHMPLHAFVVLIFSSSTLSWLFFYF